MDRNGVASKSGQPLMKDDDEEDDDLEEKKGGDDNKEEKSEIISNSIQILSDIHLEFPTTYEKMKQIRKKSSIVALLGDIGYPKHNSYKEFISDMSKLFEIVIVIAGNHEYFTDEYYSVIDKIENIVNQYENVYFLNNKCLDLPNNILGDNIRILGTTLWTNYPNYNVTRLYASRISEFKVIDILKNNKNGQNTNKNSKNSGKNKNGNGKENESETRLLTSVDLNKIYENNIKWLKEELKRAKSDKKRVIILTHHAPTDYLCIDNDLKTQVSNKENRKLQAYYMQFVANYSNCEQLFQPPLIGWFFGHTHHNCDFYIKCGNKSKNKNKTNKNGNAERQVNDDWYIRIATNQQGYLLRSTRKAEDYVDAKVISFDISNSNNQNVNSNVSIVDYQQLIKEITSKQDIFSEMQQSLAKSQQQNNNSTNCCPQCSKCCCIVL